MDQYETPGHEELKRFDSDHCYIDYFVRQENLEADFCEAVQKVRTLSEDDRQAIYSEKRTNTSERKLPVSSYYDDESISLVAEREKFLIEKFDYSALKPIESIKAG